MDLHISIFWKQNLSKLIVDYKGNVNIESMLWTCITEWYSGTIFSSREYIVMQNRNLK